MSTLYGAHRNMVGFRRRQKPGIRLGNEMGDDVCAYLLEIVPRTDEIGSERRLKRSMTREFQRTRVGFRPQACRIEEVFAIGHEEPDGFTTTGSGDIETLTGSGAGEKNLIPVIPWEACEVRA